MDEKPKLQLTGKDGNAYFIIGEARRAGKNAGWDDKKLASMIEDLTSGDYDHLLQTTMTYFNVE